MRIGKAILFVLILLNTDKLLAESIVPIDLPEHIVQFHKQELGNFSIVNHDDLAALVVTLDSKSFVENLIRSEVLFFLTKDDKVNASVLFNELDMFNTYAKLIDSSPQFLWRESSLSSTHPRFVVNQIETAYHYYQNEILKFGMQIESFHMPTLTVSN